jgi:thiamine biosynthesis lipoprotein
MKLFRQTFHAMAGEHELQLACDDIALAQRAAAVAIADVQRIEAKYSRYREDSVTSRINAASGARAVEIDGETAALMRYADQCYAQSDGLFDITSGVLRRAWNFRSDPPRVPSAQELAPLIDLIDWPHVEWSATSVRLPRKGMEIDFGGIGKEYAADRVATICVEHGLHHGMVSLGGDIRAIGPQADGAPWRVGIRHPRVANAAIAGFDLAQGALATSGDYERYFDVGGKRYCHILNPRTGMPVTHWQSISVVSPLCVVAGSCATIAMLLEDRGASFLDAQDVQWLGVAADGTLAGPVTVARTS